MNMITILMLRYAALAVAFEVVSLSAMAGGTWSKSYEPFLMASIFAIMGVTYLLVRTRDTQRAALISCGLGQIGIACGVGIAGILWTFPATSSLFVVMVFALLGAGAFLFSLGAGMFMGLEAIPRHRRTLLRYLACTVTDLIAGLGFSVGIWLSLHDTSAIGGTVIILTTIFRDAVNFVAFGSEDSLVPA